MATTLQRAYENLRTSEAVFRDANRFRQILGVLTRHGFGALVQQLNLDDRWLLKKVLEMRSAEIERLPLERRILLTVHDLGATFVKLGQILSTRPDLLPPALIAELKTLQDQVPPIPLADVRSIVRAELGAEIEAHFDQFDAQPLASASIAQVHRRNMVAVLAATAAVCGTLALDHGAPIAFGIPLLSGCFYTAAGVLGAWFLRARG